MERAWNDVQVYGVEMPWIRQTKSGADGNGRLDSSALVEIGDVKRGYGIWKRRCVSK